MNPVLAIVALLLQGLLIGLSVALFATTTEVQYLVATLGWTAIFVANVIEFKEKRSGKES